jgi:hypothetical protein
MRYWEPIFRPDLKDVSGSGHGKNYLNIMHHQ